MTTNTTPALNTTTAPALVFSDETLTAAAALADHAYSPLWIGPSGEQSTGEAVARHLDATIVLLDQDGWTRTTTYTTPSTGLPADDTGMTVKDMVRALLRLIRDEIDTPVSRHSLSTALNRVGGGDQGDPDTAWIAGNVLDVIVRAHTGSASARAFPWSERLVRTHEDIVALLTAGAAFARAHGPSTDSVGATAP
ncbi:hypothetical protein OG887_44220 (plasmid) [Streptomyces sp. NBC_00053]|uniref:Uncharacterized protein n=1 Tax=Streptomyces sanglieri TaxID=193460 RepID=A0ABW2WR30_9ACTN|nr:MULTISPECIES: hypothetical protein [unclassified Streptomyces]MCX4399999.1 hypothetical protein [Streptomyces sp. NBC_01767]MCX5106891.1 hypothetical protein [Streptomyces sp. NBC_00439]MCX5505999.1 hypothetical protein [Streptomyces sp. NBC_00052]MCX5554347.1 hypothetical protein [Streptomyces sp. NBC_00051]